MPTAIMPKRAIPIAADVSVEPVRPEGGLPGEAGRQRGNGPAEDEVHDGGAEQQERLRDAEKPGAGERLIEQSEERRGNADHGAGDEGANEAPGEPAQAKFRNARGQTPDAPGDQHRGQHDRQVVLNEHHHGVQGHAGKAGDNEPVGDEVGGIGDQTHGAEEAARNRVSKSAMGLAAFIPASKMKDGWVSWADETPPPAPSSPQKNTVSRGRLGDGEELEQHKHIAAGGEDEEQRVGEAIAQPGAARHDRGTILAVVGDERTDGQNGDGEDGQGLLPGVNGPEESGRDRVNEA